MEVNTEKKRTVTFEGTGLIKIYGMNGTSIDLSTTSVLEGPILRCSVTLMIGERGDAL